MSRRKSMWAVRTVVDGAVKIEGAYYKTLASAPQLEGLRLAFQLYRTEGALLDYVTLWGTEKMFSENLTRQEFEDCKEEFKELALHWMYWRKIERIQKVD